MADLSHKLEMVLDKLYNLKGEDNVILVKVNKDISDTENAISKAKEDQEQNEENKKSSQDKLRIFLDQKQVFENAFAGLDDNTFGALRAIGVNIDLGTMLTNLTDKSPEYIASLEGEIEKYQNAVNELITKGESLAAMLNASLEARAKAEDDQRRLISLLEQSLSSESIERESLTVHHVKGVLNSFGIFDDAELSKLSKLIMFPDEGLIDYDRNYANKKLNAHTAFQDVVEPVPAEPGEKSPVEEEAVEEPVVVEEVIPEEPAVEESTQSVDEDVVYITDDTPPVEESEEVIHEDIKAQEINPFAVEETPGIEPSFYEEVEDDASQDKEEPTDDSKEETSPSSDVVIEDISTQEEGIDSIEEFLISIGLDIEKFKSENVIPVEDIYKRLAAADHRVITENYEILRSIDVHEETYQYRKGHLYLTDKDLNKKLTLLRSKGISEAKITELVRRSNSGMRESYDTISSRVAAIENFDKKVDDSNIYIIAEDAVRYDENVEELLELGYELGKDERNYKSVLFETPYIASDAEILKRYLISIQRSNGKYALDVFWQTPQALLYAIDDLVESELENLIATNPEVLGTQCENVIGRVKYCEEKGLAIYKDNSNTFVEYIPSYYEFTEKFGRNITLPTLPDRASVNASLPSLIDNEISDIMVNTLDEYYESNSFLEDTKLSPEAQIAFDRLQAEFETTFGAQVIGKFTYNVDGVCISKIKFERHLSVLLQALIASGSTPDGLEKEIILIAALYNLRKGNEELLKVVGTRLGFNEENTLGGVKL